MRNFKTLKLIRKFLRNDRQNILRNSLKKISVFLIEVSKIIGIRRNFWKNFGQLTKSVTKSDKYLHHADTLKAFWNSYIM